MKLQQIAIARSGDKGNRATLSVIALDLAQAGDGPAGGASGGGS